MTDVEKNSHEAKDNTIRYTERTSVCLQEKKEHAKTWAQGTVHSTPLTRSWLQKLFQSQPLAVTCPSVWSQLTTAGVTKR